MLDVGFERRVCVGDEIIVERGGLAVEGDSLVHGTIFKSWWGCEVRGGTAKEAQLGVRIEAAMLDPAPKKKVSPAYVVGVRRRVRGQSFLDLQLELRAEF